MPLPSKLIHNPNIKWNRLDFIINFYSHMCLHRLSVTKALSSHAFSEICKWQRDSQKSAHLHWACATQAPTQSTNERTVTMLVLIEVALLFGIVLKLNKLIWHDPRSRKHTIRINKLFIIWCSDVYVYILIITCLLNLK